MLLMTNINIKADFNISSVQLEKKTRWDCSKSAPAQGSQNLKYAQRGFKQNLFSRDGKHAKEHFVVPDNVFFSEIIQNYQLDPLVK